MHCKASQANRNLAAANLRNPKKTDTLLTFRKNHTKENGKENVTIFLQLCTKSNLTGNKLKITNNIERVFTQCLKEGKFTIRFKEPPLDVFIESDAIQAKNFCNHLKCCLTGTSLDKVPFSCHTLSKSSDLSKPKTSLKVTSKNDYKQLRGASSLLQKFSATSVSLNRFDPILFSFRKLEVCDLSDNLIRSLPLKVCQMVLTDLNLSGNRLTDLSGSVFEGTISTTLSKINLAHNQMTYLPRSFCLLSKLVTADLRDNRLKRLPFGISRLKSLMHLNVSENALDSLPALITRCPLNELLFDGNPLNGYQHGEVLFNDVTQLLPLKELAARKAATHRSLTVKWSRHLPSQLRSLVRYPCLCFYGCVIISHSMVCCVDAKQNHLYEALAKSISVIVGPLPLLHMFCSVKCHEKFCRGRKRRREE